MIHKWMACLMSAMIAVSMIGGCSQAKGKANRDGEADNEILTLSPIPDGKQLLTIRSQDGIDSKRIEEAIEAEFPNVDIVMVDNTAEQMSLDHQDFEDIFLTANAPKNRMDLTEIFVDLSAEPFTSNYYLASLNDCQTDGKLYYLPGPSNIYGIVYNKTMFEEHGWEVPSNLNEFIALCDTIQKTGIRPLQPAFYYRDAVRQFFFGFTYDTAFSGINPMKWLQEYQGGKAVMKGHMDPAMEVMRRLQDAGAWKTSDFDVRPSERSKMMYETQSCAMILETLMAPVYEKNAVGTEGPELAMMPFYSGNGPDSGYLISVPQYYIMLNKRLEEPGNEEKMAMAKEILAFISTAEGQRATSDEKVTLMSNIMEWTLEDNPFTSGILPTIEKGHVFPQLFFIGSATSDFDTVFREELCQWSAGTRTRENLYQACDDARDEMLERGEQTIDGQVIGEALEDFSVMETAAYMAEVFRQASGAQIGICAANTRDQGINVKIYEGPIEIGREGDIDYFIRWSFIDSAIDKEAQHLLLVTMKGADIRQLLEHPYHIDDDYPDAYYVAAGLKIEFAPWAKEGNRIVSVTMADGSALEDEETYTLAYWNGSVDPKYAKEELQCFETGALDLFVSSVEQAQKITPFRDGRFVINWDIRE